MQITCGTDIIEIERIKELIDSTGDKFLNRVYTPKEISYCESKGQMRYQHYAARFAAKEATFKAISNLLDSKYEIGWRNIEVTNDDCGRPKIDFVGTKISELKGCDISLSHCKEYAVASVVAFTD